MNLDEALELFDEIVELCYDTDNQRLIEFVEPIHREALTSKSITQVIALSEEIQIFLNEIDLSPEEEEIAQDVQEKIEILSE